MKKEINTDETNLNPEIVKQKLIKTLVNILDTNLVELYDDNMLRLRQDLPAKKLACIKEFKSKEKRDSIVLHSKIHTMQLLTKLIAKDETTVYGKFELCNFDDFFAPEGKAKKIDKG